MFTYDSVRPNFKTVFRDFDVLVDNKEFLWNITELVEDSKSWSQILRVH